MKDGGHVKVNESAPRSAMADAARAVLEPDQKPSAIIRRKSMTKRFEGSPDAPESE